MIKNVSNDLLIRTVKRLQDEAITKPLCKFHHGGLVRMRAELRSRNLNNPLARMLLAVKV